jgi:hypothetical protein
MSARASPLHSEFRIREFAFPKLAVLSIEQLSSGNGMKRGANSMASGTVLTTARPS